LVCSFEFVTGFELGAGVVWKRLVVVGDALLVVATRLGIALEGMFWGALVTLGDTLVVSVTTPAVAIDVTLRFKIFISRSTATGRPLPLNSIFKLAIVKCATTASAEDLSPVLTLVSTRIPSACTRLRSFYMVKFYSKFYASSRVH
jgi:hypothetical protein